jgi:hypothetical protein
MTLVLPVLVLLAAFLFDPFVDGWRRAVRSDP